MQARRLRLQMNISTREIDFVARECERPRPCTHRPGAQPRELVAGSAQADEINRSDALRSNRAESSQ